MIKPVDVFFEVSCLTETSNLLNGLALQKKWFKAADKRIIGQYLQKFIAYNNKLFDFIGTSPFLVGTDQKISLCFRTSQFIGCIPLRSPDTGKQIGDFVVAPRFAESDRYSDYIEILDLLKDEISPEIIESLPLVSGRNFRPPMYLEVVKFIQSLDELVKKSWKKFDRIEKLQAEPTGQVDWRKYIARENRIENRLRFPVGKNILNEFHSEYSNIRYVFDLCKLELSSSNTPLRIKLLLRNKIEFLDNKLYNHIPIYTKDIRLKFSDSPFVREAKIRANNILKYNFIESTAWRIDFADVFEKFVQFIFKDVAKELGGKLYSNYKLKGHFKRKFDWKLEHVEPDAIFKKDELLIFIDAKYKSNLYNKYSSSELLKDEHRHDLHQILAYSSFDSKKTKIGFLCYPSEELEIEEMRYENLLNGTNTKIIILGLPLKIEIVSKAKRLLIDQFFEVS